MKIDAVLMLFLGAVVAFLGRAGWDYFSSGRLEKGVYTKTKDCEKLRSSCCLSGVTQSLAIVKTEFETHKSEVNTKLISVEKRLDTGERYFEILNGNVTGIKTDIAGMKPLIEMMASHIQKQSDGKK